MYGLCWFDDILFDDLEWCDILRVGIVYLFVGD